VGSQAGRLRVWSMRCLSMVRFGPAGVANVILLNMVLELFVALPLVVGRLGEELLDGLLKTDRGLWLAFVRLLLMGCGINSVILAFAEFWKLRAIARRWGKAFPRTVTPVGYMSISVFAILMWLRIIEVWLCTPAKPSDERQLAQRMSFAWSHLIAASVVLQVISLIGYAKRHRITASAYVDSCCRTVTLEAGSEETCCFCLACPQAGEAVAILPCGHSFHRDCVQPWYLKEHRCPFRCDEGSS